MREYIDKETGAIIFKKSPEQKRYEELIAIVEEYKSKVEELEAKVTELYNIIAKDI